MTSSTRSPATLYKRVLGLSTLTLIGVFTCALLAGPGGLLHPQGEGAVRAATIVIAPMTPRPTPTSTLAPAVTTTTVAPVTTTTSLPVTTKSSIPVVTTTTLPAPKPSVVQSDSSAPAPASAPATAPGTVFPRIADPAGSVTPSTQMQSACFGAVNIVTCNSDSLAAIDQARATEGLAALQLPSNFYSLSNDNQLLAVINAERTSRGLPAFAFNPSFGPAAQSAAQSTTDPISPTGTVWAGILSMDYPTVLSADFGWMYDDGPGSPNIDCTPSNSSGCWGHRDAILSRWAGWAAAGSALVGASLNLTALFVAS